MSKKYNEWKEHTLDLCKDEYERLSCKILNGEELIKPEEVNEKSYMEYLEDKIIDLEYENKKLKIRYIDFKSIKEENEIYKIEILKLNQELIKIKSLHKNLEGYVKAEMDLIDLKSQLKKLQDS